MKLYRPIPLEKYTPTGLRRLVNLAERAVAALQRMDGDVEVRIGEPSFRIGLPVEIVRAELQRQIEDARATPAWRGVTR